MKGCRKLHQILGLKSDPTFCLGLPIKKTNSAGERFLTVQFEFLNIHTSGENGIMFVM